MLKLSQTQIFKFFLVIILIISGLKNSAKTFAASGYWHTNGSQILDSANQPVSIAGVNWFGLETGSFAPHGLWARNYRDILRQVKQLGFNTIRLPYSNQALDAASQPNGIDYDKNPDLKNLSSLAIMDKVIEAAGDLELKIILDQHRPDSNAQSSLWYSSSLSESKWISDWQMLATRYQNNSTVVGVDLHNEPHDNACWGCGDLSRDWAIASQKAGNAILEINPNLLIIIEGVQMHDNQWYWWGGNLMGVKNQPINLKIQNRVVYSPHDYPMSVNNQPWFTDSSYPKNLPALWDNQWGYIQKSGIAPIIIGEFGTKLESDSDRQWLSSLTSYIKQNNISWIFWSLNPNSGDTGGILNDDWQTVNQSKMDYLRNIQDGLSDTPLPSSSPVNSPTDLGIPSSQELIQSIHIKDNWGSGFIAEVTLKNQLPNAVNGWSTTLNVPSNQQVDELWGGIMTRSSTGIITITNTTWNHTIPAYGSVTLGFKGSISNDQPQPVPNPAPTPAPVQIDIWWPTSETAVSGIQPLKAVVSGLSPDKYQMFWQVDGGQLNLMESNHIDSAHKETMIDFSGWTWKGRGPYLIQVVAKNTDGSEIGRKSVSVNLLP